MTKEELKKIMDIPGLARYLDISKSTLYKLAQEGKLPGQKVGKHWRFRKETIDEWLGERIGGEKGKEEEKKPDG